MPFYRILLVTRNDLAVASIYNKFVETAKYVMNNGGIFQRIYNTGDHLFRYPMFCKANSKTYTQGPIFALQFCSSPQVMEKVCDSLKGSTYYLRLEKEKINTMTGIKLYICFLQTLETFSFLKLKILKLYRRRAVSTSVAPTRKEEVNEKLNKNLDSSS